MNHLLFLVCLTCVAVASCEERETHGEDPSADARHLSVTLTIIGGKKVDLSAEKVLQFLNIVRSSPDTAIEKDAELGLPLGTFKISDGTSEYVLYSGFVTQEGDSKRNYWKRQFFIKIAQLISEMSDKADGFDKVQEYVRANKQEDVDSKN